jgi:hypothetical protein
MRRGVAEAYGHEKTLESWRLSVDFDDRVVDLTKASYQIDCPGGRLRARGRGWKSSPGCRQ